MATKSKSRSQGSPPDRTEKFSQNLKCTLSQQEVAQRADRAANLVVLITDKDEDRKAANKHAQGEIDQLTSELSQLSNEVRTKATYRNVECERRFVYSEQKVREDAARRLHLLNTRAMTEREMQLELFTDDNGKPESPAGRNVAGRAADRGPGRATAKGVCWLRKSR